MNHSFSDVLHTRRVLKYIFIIVLIFGSCNHAVRGLSSVSPTNVTLGNWSLPGPNVIIGSVDDLRSNIGQEIGRLGIYCPSSAQKVCSKGISGFRVLMGFD